MLLRNEFMPALMASAVKLGQTMVGFGQATASLYCFKVPPYRALQYHRGGNSLCLKGFIHLGASCHLVISWYCMKSFWYPVSLFRTESLSLVSYCMWRHSQKCLVAPGSPPFGLCDDSRWHPSHGSQCFLNIYCILYSEWLDMCSV